MAGKALNNVNTNGVSGDIREMAAKALDNLNNGKAGEAGDLQESAKAALR
jgi:hypothetical protein